LFGKIFLRESYHEDDLSSIFLDTPPQQFKQ